MDLTQLHRMANQIARNLAAQGDEAAITATAQHLQDFWDPRMKAAILKGSRETLDPIAQAAVERLDNPAGQCVPPHLRLGKSN